MNISSFDVVHAPIRPGISLVEASAGTGKTYSIAMSVVRLLLELDAGTGQPLVGGIGNILVVTFTNAATDELVTRIRGFLRLAADALSGVPVNEQESAVQQFRHMAHGREVFAAERMRTALAEVDALAVFTIHGFCKRVLDEFALESGTPFGAVLLDDEAELIGDALEDWWRRTFYADRDLAAFAVAHEWSPASFYRDYITWRNWPSAQLDPFIVLADARVDAINALDAFSQAWDADGFRGQATGIKWKKDAPCQAESLDDLLARAAAAANGDLGAACTVAEQLSIAGLQEFAWKQGKAHQAALDGIVDWPVAQVATQLAVALDRLEAALRVDCFTRVLALATREKTRRNALGFNDLLARLAQVLTTQGRDGALACAIREQFHAALIDEFQDTDLQQFAIFDTAFAGRPLFLIGDPKQAIYGFRGADVHAYLEAITQATQRFTLGNNFRSTPRMTGAVNALLAQRAAPFLQEEIGFLPAQAARDEAPPHALPGRHALHWLFVEPEMGSKGAKATSAGTARALLFAACVRHIQGLVAQHWLPGRMAVLVRSGRDGLAMEALLRDAGIPAVVAGMGDVMHSEEAGELQLLLEAIANPRHALRVRAALATHLWGLQHADLVRLSSDGGQGEWESLLEHFEQLREQWATRGLLGMLQQLFATQQVYARWLAYEDGERRVTNLRHLVELLHGAAVAEHLNVEGVLRWLAMQRQHGPDDRTVNELRLETDADAVQIVTVHKSKGLEYDIVFCPMLWSSFPMNDSDPVLVHDGDDIVFDLGSPERARRGTLADMERLAEELRLTYVALTRARFRTYVGWGPIAHAKGHGSWSAGLSYLLSDLPVDGMPVADRPGAVRDAMQANPARWGELLQAFVERHGALMQVEHVDSALVTPTRLTLEGAHVAPLQLRTLPADPPPRVRFDTFAVASFTSLTSGHVAGGVAMAVPDVARDVDDAPQSDSGDEAAVFASRGNTSIAARDLPPSDFRSFPAGRRAGTVLHTLFEQSRFDDTVVTLRERAARVLPRERLALDESDPRLDAVADMMQRVFAAPLEPWAFALAQVARTRAKHEWEFLLPLAHAEQAFTRFALADAFATHGDEAGRAYAAALRRLSVGRLHGFLTGFVDLVFEHDGRWYVVDWKSTQLGADPDAYAPSALGIVMDAHHYTLQAHLYLVALHRFLQLRVPDYDYDRHMGGAAYAFLRGFGDGASTSGHGWCTMRPPRALIEALSALMDHQRDAVQHQRAGRTSRA
jgi:exodeoxyribonuclease V beta subunit